jgi:hypothetical protein
MIKKEYERLMQLVEKSARLEVSVEEILRESVGFFEKLRAEFPKAGKDQREEMIHMMTTLHERLQQVSKESAEGAGMSEEDLNAYAEDPRNFTPEQWQMVQETRRKLYDSARKFSATMDEQSRGILGERAPKRKSIKPQTRRAKRGDWTKS